MQFGILLKHSNVVIIPCEFWKVKKVTKSTFDWYFCFLLNELYLWYDLNRGNWWGHSPYKHGTPCSACPPSYGGGCKDNLCYKGSENLDGGTGEHKNHFFPHCTPFLWFYSGPPQEETEENNLIESEAPYGPQKPWSRPSLPTQAPVKPPTDTEKLQKNEVVNTQQMCKMLFLLFILDLVSSKNGGQRICFVWEVHMGGARGAIAMT